MRTLYFDCFAGASGNMIIGALFAAGLNEPEFRRRLAMLGVSGYEIVTTTVDRSGISAKHVDVKVPHEHVHRHLKDIEAIIFGSHLSDGVKERAFAIFTRLAEAEAKVHGTDVAKVHFHEVGAMDAIIDIVGACIGFEMLEIDNFACSKIHLGSGFVNMAHGKFPVPPPAVAELLQDKPVYSTEIEGELITPTGAAIITAVCDSYGVMPEMTVEVTGYGAGTREYKDFPNVLRLMIGETSGNAVNREILQIIETNLDDVSPQILGHVMDRAFELGAKDCWFTPIQMKKNRPAVMLSVLCSDTEREKLAEMIFHETTTLGIRIGAIERRSLDREVVSVETEFGTIDVKIGKMNGHMVNSMPEYDQVKTAAAANGVPFAAVRDAALDRLRDKKSSAAR